MHNAIRKNAVHTRKRFLSQMFEMGSPSQRRKKCASCSDPHLNLLHDDTVIKDKQDTNGTVPMVTFHQIEASHSKTHAKCYSHSLIVLAWLHHEQASQEKQLFMCFWMTNQTFASSKNQFWRTCNKVVLKSSLGWQQFWKRKSLSVIDGPTVQGLNETTSIRLPGGYSREDIPAKRG